MDSVELALRQLVFELNAEVIVVGVIIRQEPVIHAPVSVFRVLGHGVQEQTRLPAAESAAAAPCLEPRFSHLEALIPPADALLAHFRAVDELIQQIVIGALPGHAVRGQIQSVPPLHLQPAVEHIGDADMGDGRLRPAILCGFFHTGRIAVGIIAIPRCFFLNVILIVDNGLVQRPDLLDEDVVLPGCQVIIAAGGVDVHQLYAVRCGDAAGHAEQIVLHGAAQGRAAQRHRQHSLPCGLEHPGRFRQQHGRRVIAHGAARDHAQDHGQEREVLAVLKTLPQQGVQQPSAQNGGVDGAAVPEHRLHPAHGHHISGALAAASAVQQPRQSQQRRARGGIGGDEPAVFQRHGGQHTGLIPLTAQSIRHPLGLVGAVGRDLLHEVYHGAEPLHGTGIAAVQAEAEALRQQVHHEVRQHGDEVQQPVKGGQHEHVAHDKCAKGSKAEEEQALPHNA